MALSSTVEARRSSASPSWKRRRGRAPSRKTVANPQPAGTVDCMLSKLNTFALMGIEALPVEVEVDCSEGLPKTVLVGLPEQAVKESTHRIERALANLGYERPTGRSVINLAPADLP